MKLILKAILASIGELILFTVVFGTAVFVMAKYPAAFFGTIIVIVCWSLIHEKYVEMKRIARYRERELKSSKCDNPECEQCYDK